MRHMMTNSEAILEHLRKSAEHAVHESAKIKPPAKKNIMLENSLRNYHKKTAIAEFTENVLSFLMESAIETIVNHILEQEGGDDEDKRLAKSAIHTVMESNDSMEMVNKMATRNVLTSSISAYCIEYTNLIVESAKKEHSCGEEEDIDFKMDKLIADDFIEKIKDVVPARAIKLIRTRVAKSIDDFITQQAQDKATIVDIYNKANEKIKSLPAETNESVAADYRRMAKRATNEVYDHPTNFFGAMVQSLGESAIKDKNAMFVNESGILDSKKVINTNAVVFTVLETVNTLEISTISADDVREMLTNN